MKAIIKRRDFSAKLPDDFGMLLSVKDSCNDHLCNTESFKIPFINTSKANNFEQFTIDGHRNRIVFSGSFSRWWIISIFQKLWDNFFPKKYKIEYITIKEIKELNKYGLKNLLQI